MRVIVIAASAVLVAGCGEGSANKEAEAESVAAALQPGEYALTWSKVDIQSTDNTTPATSVKVDANGSTTAFPEKACVAAGGVIDPAAFAEKGDECRPNNSYVRNGVLNLQLACAREGHEGPVMQNANGRFTADGFSADIATSTYFKGSGNYAMNRTVTGKRVGECAAKES